MHIKTSFSTTEQGQIFKDFWEGLPVFYVLSVHANRDTRVHPFFDRISDIYFFWCFGDIELLIFISWLTFPYLFNIKHQRSLRV